MLTHLNPKLISPCQYEGRVLDDDLVKRIAAEYDPLQDEAIQVRPDTDNPGRYILIDGHHRHAAHLLLGTDVEARIIDADAARALYLSVAKNNARNQDKPSTKGRAYLQLIAAGYTKAKAAEAIGTTTQTAEQYADLARLDPRVLAMHENGEGLGIAACALIARIKGLDSQRSGQYRLALEYMSMKSHNDRYSLADFAAYCAAYERALNAPKAKREQAIITADDETEQELRANAEALKQARAGQLKARHATLLAKLTALMAAEPELARQVYDLATDALDGHGILITQDGPEPTDLADTQTPDLFAA